MLKQFVRIAGCAALIALTWAAPARAQDDQAGPPGTINYVEGDAWIGPNKLTTESVRSTELSRGETLTTKTGKAEVLLTPGVFLRVDDNSSVTMVSADLANIDVTVDAGRAAVEVLNIMKDNDIRLGLGDVSTRLVDDGFYEFDANRDEVLAFEGKAEVYIGNQAMELKGKHVVALGTVPLEAHKFDTRKEQDNFFRWCELRSGYLSRASAKEARTYVGMAPGWYGPGWYGSGWYWDPGLLAYTYVPSDGIFYSPFGWGYYSPDAIYGAPFYYGSGFGDFDRPYARGFERREFREGGHEREGGRFHDRDRDHDRR